MHDAPQDDCDVFKLREFETGYFHRFDDQICQCWLLSLIIPIFVIISLVWILTAHGRMQFDRCKSPIFKSFPIIIIILCLMRFDPNYKPKSVALRISQKTNSFFPISNTPSVAGRIICACWIFNRKRILIDWKSKSNPFFKLDFET